MFGIEEGCCAIRANDWLQISPTYLKWASIADICYLSQVFEALNYLWYHLFKKGKSISQGLPFLIF